MRPAELVSVVLPVYNARQYVEAALRSVMDQTHRHLEIILIDDGSTDGSADVVEVCADADPRIRVVRQDNRGICAARNRGVNLARGKYVYFMDHDDYLYPTALEVAVEALESSRGCVAKFAVEYHTVGPRDTLDVSVLAPRPGSYSKQEIATHYLELRRQGLFEFVWNGLYRRDLLDRLGRMPFDPHFTVGGEDLDLNTRVFPQVTRCEVLPDVLYRHWRRFGQSAVYHRDPDGLANSERLADSEAEAMRHLSCSATSRLVVGATHATGVALEGVRARVGSADLARTVRMVLGRFGSPFGPRAWGEAFRHSSRYTSFCALAHLRMGIAMKLLVRLHTRGDKP